MEQGTVLIVGAGHAGFQVAVSLRQHGYGGRIGLINSDVDYLYARQRQQGYLDALTEAGIAPDPRWRMNLNSLDYEAGASAAVTLTQQPHAPSAIFAVSDTLAIGVIQQSGVASAMVPTSWANSGSPFAS